MTSISTIINNSKQIFPTEKVITEKIQGIVTKEADNHRHTRGVIEYKSPSGVSIVAAFTFDDSVMSISRVSKGDEVMFTLETRDGTLYSRGIVCHSPRLPDK